jgi:hypothetical protein
MRRGARKVVFEKSSFYRLIRLSEGPLRASHEVSKLKKVKKPLVVPPGMKIEFRAWTTTKDGKRIWAKWYGIKAFPILVPA